LQNFLCCSRYLLSGPYSYALWSFLTVRMTQCRPC
jgi:hypothetical protein